MIAALNSSYIENLVKMLEANGQGHSYVVTIPDIDGVTLQALIRFCYLGRIQIAENVETVLAAASVLQITQVLELCEQYCIRVLSRDNCQRWEMLADRYDLTRLKQNAGAMVSYFQRQ